MLTAKIKCDDRGEVKRHIWGKKKSFKYLDTTYHVKPGCIYQADTFFGLWRYRAIDYVQGNGNPVDYYGSTYAPVKTGKNLDTISLVVNRWLQGKFAHFQEITMILHIVTIALTGIGVYMAYEIGKAVGAW